MTTPRDEVTALLAEALFAADHDFEDFGAVSTKEAAAMMLAASPTLAADLEFAAAWRRVERALPEGSLFSIGNSLDRWSTMAWKAAPRLNVVAEGPTPTAALTRLAEALEAMR